MRYFGAKPAIMAILNITPDSFSDGGLYLGIDEAVNHVLRMVADGADIIDIGGESTRPGAKPVAAAEQIRRVVPVIKALRQALPPSVPLSIDTTLSAVAEAALAAGADFVNDTAAGLDDPRMLPLVAQADTAIVLMHRQGTPKTMQDNPFYHDVVAEVLAKLRERIGAALEAGIRPEHIIIDPGIGFGKRRQDNLDLLANLDLFVATGYPVLLGASRKRFMGGLCAVAEPAGLVTATAVTTALGVMAGARLFRVHDVRENRQAADIAWAVKEAGVN